MMFNNSSNNNMQAQQQQQLNDYILIKINYETKKYSLNLTHPYYDHKKRKRKQKLYLYTPFQWKLTKVIGIKLNCGVLHIRKNIKRSHLHPHQNISFETSAVACNSTHCKFTDTHHSQLAAQTSCMYIHIIFSTFSLRSCSLQSLNH